MAAKVGQSEEVISDINVTPFVDIVLVLLIILMVTSTHIVKAAIEVDLPKAASGGQSVSTTVNVVLTAEGELFLDGAPITLEALGPVIRARSKKEEKLQAVISADQRISYGRVVELIDTVKKNGVTSFALNIERIIEKPTQE